MEILPPDRKDYTGFYFPHYFHAYTSPPFLHNMSKSLFMKKSGITLLPGFSTFNALPSSSTSFFFYPFLPHLFYFVVFFLIYLISFSIFTLQATQVARPRGILPVIPMASPGVPTSICPCFHSLPLFFNACTIS